MPGIMFGEVRDSNEIDKIIKDTLAGMDRDHNIKVSLMNTSPQVAIDRMIQRQRELELKENAREG